MMSKHNHKAKHNINQPEKQKSKSYIIISGIGAFIWFGLAIAILISGFIYHIWVFVFPVLFAFLLGLGLREYPVK